MLRTRGAAHTAHTRCVRLRALHLMQSHSGGPRAAIRAGAASDGENRQVQGILHAQAHTHTHSLTRTLSCVETPPTKLSSRQSRKPLSAARRRHLIAPMEPSAAHDLWAWLVALPADTSLSTRDDFTREYQLYRYACGSACGLCAHCSVCGGVV